MKINNARQINYLLLKNKCSNLLKPELIVKKTDRIILLLLIIGIWGFIGTLWFRPDIVAANAVNTRDNLTGKHSHKTQDISRFKWKVRRIVEDCSVTEGEILC